MAWYWDAKRGKRRRTPARLLRRLAITVGVVVVLLLLLGAGLWVADDECFRTSAGTVKRRVVDLQHQIAGSDWKRACASLVPRLQRQYAAIGDGDCADGLRLAIRRGGAHLAPITRASVNDNETRATVTTRERVYKFSKPETGGCAAWRVASMSRPDR